MKILGIDPGTATVGWGVIETEGNTVTLIGFGHISTSKDLPQSKRLQEIASDVQHLLHTYQPDEAALEELFFYNNQKTALSVAEARGVILLTLENFSITVAGYTPLEVKQSLTNYGRADKKQVQSMVQKVLSLQSIPKPDDAADALAIALCHGARRKFDAQTK